MAPTTKQVYGGKMQASSMFKESQALLTFCLSKIILLAPSKKKCDNLHLEGSSPACHSKEFSYPAIVFS